MAKNTKPVYYDYTCESCGDELSQSFMESDRQSVAICGLGNIVFYECPNCNTLIVDAHVHNYTAVPSERK